MYRRSLPRQPLAVLLLVVVGSGMAAAATITCPHQRGTRRYLAPDPALLLLAFGRDGKSLTVPETCDRVDRRGEQWIALSPYGAPLERVRVTALDRYEPYEGFLQFEPLWSVPFKRLVGPSREGPFRVALFAATDAPAPSPPTAVWKPTAAERQTASTAVEVLATSVSPTFQPYAACMRRKHDADECQTFDSRMLFFSAALGDDTNHDGKPERGSSNLVAAGSRDFLAVLVYNVGLRRFGLDGLMLRPNEHNDGRITPVGVIDVDGDRFPEVIVRITDSVDWSYAVLRRVRAGKWEVLAEGASGSTA